MVSADKKFFSRRNIIKMKLSKKIISAMLVVVVMLSFSIVTCFAATITDGGMEVTLLTDRERYNADDSIEITLRVKNNRDYAVKNVSLATILPEGYELAEGYQNSDTAIEELGIGQSTELVVVCTQQIQPTQPVTQPVTENPTQKATSEPATVPATASPTAAPSVTNATNAANTTVSNTTVSNTTASGTSGGNSVVNTGQTVMALSVFGVLCLAAFAVYSFAKKGKGRQILSVVLSVAVLGSAAVCVPVSRAYAYDEQKVVNISTTVTVENSELTINAVVKYELAADIVQPTPARSVLSLDEDDENIEIYSFSSSHNNIAIGDTAVVSFTAEIFSNVVIEENAVNVIDSHRTVIGTMNDNGIDGDDIANDGIYSLTTELSSTYEKTENYYVTVGNVVSEACSIDYYAPLTDEDFSNMRTVEERVKSLCSTEEFLSKTTSQKSELVSGLLSELSNEGLIKSDSIYYDEEGKMYTFQYPCGVLSGIQLENTLYDVDAVGGNTAKVAAVETVASGNNATEISGTSETATKRALVLESFENTPFRTDFYQNMEEEWDGMNLDTTVDYDVTLYDLCGIMKYDYDVIVFAMHGGEYNRTPSSKISYMVLDSETTEDADRHYSYEIARGMVAKIWCADRYHYWVAPDFFSYRYSGNHFDNTFIYIQCCMGFGCDCRSTSPDYAMAQAFTDRGAEVVVGYHNSVDSNYGRNVMKDVIEKTFNGQTVSDAVDGAKGIYGNDDNSEIITSHKYKAYPVISGDSNFVLRHNGNISGRVMNAANNARISDALVRVYNGEGECVATARTNTNGDYTINIAPGDYIAKITAGGYRSIRIGVTVESNQTTYNASTLLMLVSDIISVQANGVVTNSLTAEGVGDVTVSLRRNWNNKTGDVLYTTSTNSNGYYAVEYEAGFYTIEFSKEGFIPTYKNIFIGLGLTNSQDATISPAETEGTYRIVLTWGENPRDVDSHVYGKFTNGSAFHVYYINKSEYYNGTEICNLDVDDTTSYGPETITLKPTVNGVYYYYLHRYAGEGYLSTSNAQINVYSGNTLVRTFNVPADKGNSDYWNVFAIKNNSIIVNNTITYEPNTSYAD